MSNQLYHFSATWFSTLDSQPIILAALKETCNKFIFQLEKAPTTGNLHYQAYLNLRVKQRAGELAKLLNGLGLNGVSVQPSSNAGKVALKRYCMKPETRIAGPWADKPIYLGADLPKQLRLWQLGLKAKLLAKPHPRKIYWYYDPIGGQGKSIFSKYMYYHHQVPALTFGNAGDLLNFVYKNQGQPAYIFDLSRTKGGKTSMSDIYQAIESIKNGYFINTKYDTAAACFNIPNIVVFSNHPPDLKCLSADRWEVSQMSQEIYMSD